MAEAEALKICSNGMILIGADAVVSFTDGTNESQTADAFYERTIRSALTEHRWNFSIGSYQASRDVEAPKTEFAYKYTLPAPILTIDKITPDWIEYELYAERTIHTDFKGELYVEGQYRIDETQMPDYFLEYVEARLAAKFAFPVVGDLVLAREMETLAKTYQLKAKAADSKQRKRVGIKKFPLIQVRG